MAWTPERVRRFWDYESQFPERYYSFKYGEQIIDRAAALLELTPGSTWLDYGCGYGSFSELLLRRGYGVVIHDLSPDSLEECARRCGAHDRFYGPLGERPAKIDVVALLEVVEHVDRPTLRQIFDSLRQACPPATRVVVTTPNAEDLEAPDSVVYCPQCDTTRHRWQHLRSFTSATLGDELRSVGLERVRVREESFRRDKRLATANPLRKLKRLLCEFRQTFGGERPNLIAVGEL